MRVLLIATNRCRRPLTVMPLGACLLAEAAEAAGHDVRLVDLMFSRRPLRDAADAIHRFRPDVVGLSIRNIDNNDRQNPVFFFPQLKPLLACIRAATPAPVVLGGAAVGLMPEKLLRYTGADAAVVGNGERSFIQWLAVRAKGGDATRVPGVGCLIGDRFRLLPAEALAPECLAPAFERHLDLRRYRQRGTAIPMQTKRGCPFRCVYCTYAIQEGRQYRLCEPEAVADAVASLVGRGLPDIEFVDNVFNSPYPHAMAVCRAVARRRIPARLQTIELNPGFLDEPLLQAMEAAGFVGAGVTAESASDRVLRGLGKNFTARDVARAASLGRRHTLPFFWMFLLGGPGEDDESALSTLAFAEREIPSHHTVYFHLGVRVYPGTAIEKIARREGGLGAAGLFAPAFYLSPRLDAERLKARIADSMARHLNFMNWDSFAHPWLPTLSRLGTMVGLPQPFWRNSEAVRGFLRRLGWNV